MAKFKTVEYQLNFGIESKTVLIYDFHIKKIKEEFGEKSEEFLFYLAVCLYLKFGESFKLPTIFKKQTYPELGKLYRMLATWYGRVFEIENGRIIIRKSEKAPRGAPPRNRKKRESFLPKMKLTEMIERPLKKVHPILFTKTPH